MKKQGFAESTIVAVGKRLRHLSRHVNLNDPESVKGFIASKQCSNGYKESLAEAYDYYVRCNGLGWNEPLFNVRARMRNFFYNGTLEI